MLLNKKLTLTGHTDFFANLVLQVIFLEIIECLIVEHRVTGIEFKQPLFLSSCECFRNVAFLRRGGGPSSSSLSVCSAAERVAPLVTVCVGLGVSLALLRCGWLAWVGWLAWEASSPSSC